MLELENYLSNELSKCNCSKNQITQFISNLHPLLVKPREIDIKKVAGWLADKNLAFKNNPILWLNKAFIEELNNGTFDKVERHCCLHPFLVFLKQNGIKVEKNADAYLSTMFDYFINQGLFTEQELIDFNHKAVDYLANKNKTTKDFIELWQKSKVCKERNIDWNAIKAEADKLIKAHIELLKELEK